MDFEPQSLPEIVLITPRRLGDARGFFAETFRDDLFRRHVRDVAFVQDNHSRSLVQGTVRGLHFQLPPRAQGKLVGVLRGAILDVAVDLRQGSPTFARHVAVRLSADDGRQLWIPPGFAHGFMTLEPACDVTYKVTDYYSAEHDRGLRYDDPDLGIAWPATPGGLVLSDRDRAQPSLRDLPLAFVYGRC